MGRPGRPPSTTRPVGAKPQGVNALTRGLTILRCFRTTVGELSVSEIARLTGLPQSTTWRLCQTMTEAGFLAISPASGKLRVGFSGLALGYAAVARTNVGDIVLDEMQRLADEFRAASSMSARNHLDMLIVRRATAANPSLIVNLEVGAHLPIANSSAGWAYLAGVGEAERAQLLDDLSLKHGKDWPPLARQIDTALAAYRDCGYVLNAAIYRPEINAIAVPIVPSNGGPVLCLNVGGPSSVLPVEKLVGEVAPRLLQLTGVIRAGLALKPADSIAPAWA